MAEAVTFNITITKEAVEAMAALLTNMINPAREKREESTKEEERKENNPIIVCKDAVVLGSNKLGDKEQEVTRVNNNPNNNTVYAAVVLPDSNTGYVVPDSNTGKGVNTGNIPNNLTNVDEIAPPTLEEINAYIAEKGYKMDGKRFYNYYKAYNWHTKGGTPIVCMWKEYIDSWMQTGGTNTSNGKKKTSDFMTIEERRKTHPFVPTDF